MTEQANPNAAGSGPQFALHRIYLKDASLEIPNSPAVLMQDWKPEVNLQLNSAVKALEGDIYEVVLNVTVTAKQGDQTGFLAEIQQAGIFTVKGFDEQQRGSMLGSFWNRNTEAESSRAMDAAMERLRHQVTRLPPVADPAEDSRRSRKRSRCPWGGEATSKEPSSFPNSSSMESFWFIRGMMLICSLNFFLPGRSLFCNSRN